MAEDKQKKVENFSFLTASLFISRRQWMQLSTLRSTPTPLALIGNVRYFSFFFGIEMKLEVNCLNKRLQIFFYTSFNEIDNF